MLLTDSYITPDVTVKSEGVKVATVSGGVNVSAGEPGFAASVWLMADTSRLGCFARCFVSMIVSL